MVSNGSHALAELVQKTRKREPARVKLAAAIETYNEVSAALADNAAARKRADTARWAASAAATKAEAAIEKAKRSDALAAAKGGAGGAVKAARVSLQEAQDNAEATASAVTVLAEEAAQCEQRHGIAESTLARAVAEALAADPAVAALYREFADAKTRVLNLRAAMRELWRAMMPITPLPRELENLDAAFWYQEQDRAPSPTAVKLREWVEQLRKDADAAFVD